jgi:hypothetical protein
VLPDRPRIGGIALLETALIASVFFPWRRTVIGSSPATGSGPLSEQTTTHDLATVVHTLGAQTVSRVAVELLVLGAATIVLVMCGRSLLAGRAVPPTVLTVSSVACVVLTGLASFALPTIQQRAGLAFFPTFQATAACYLAFVISTLLLVVSVASRPSNAAGSIAADQSWA